MNPSVFVRSMPSTRPLPLKQRTSSVDPRRDASWRTWTSVLGLLKLREYVVTVDHFSIWRRHMAWAISDGKELRDHICQRYASSMVFMSLLLSTELGVLFNSAGVTTEMRHALMQTEHTLMSFWAGIFIIVSAILTLLSLVSTFTAWSMVSAVHPNNAHCVFRSSIGQYVAELPGRFIVCSIYSFLVWLSLFFFLLLPLGFYSILLLLIVTALFIHTITAFSAFGRIIMHTGAMGSQRIFEPEYESNLLPHSLHFNLLIKAKSNLSNSTSIMRQYRGPGMPPNAGGSSSELLSSTNSSQNASISHASETIESSIHPLLHNPFTQTKPYLASVKAARPRRRTESLVKFADGLDTNGDPWTSNASSPPLQPTDSQDFLPQRRQQNEPQSSRSVRESISPLTVEDCTSSPLSETAPLLSARPPKPSVSPRSLLFGVDAKNHADGSADSGGRPAVKQSGTNVAAVPTTGVSDEHDVYSRWLNVSSPAISSSSSSSSEGQGRASSERETAVARSADGDEDCNGASRALISSQSLSFSDEETPDAAGRQLSEEEKFDLEYGVFNDPTVDESLVCRSSHDGDAHEPRPAFDWLGPSQRSSDQTSDDQDVDAFVPPADAGRSTKANTGNQTFAEPS